MDTSKLERMGRRRFMENLAGIGVSATTLQELTRDELTDVTHDPEEEIPYVAAWKNVGRAEDGTVQREPVYETISRERWERKEATDNALQQVGEFLEGRGEDHTLVFTGAEHSPTEYGIEVKTTPEKRDRIEKILPTEQQGIATADGETVRDVEVPVDVVSTELQKQADNYDGEHYDEIPGAAPVARVVEPEEWVAGTATAPFHSDEHGDGWVMSGHVASGNGEDIVHQLDDTIDTVDLGTSRDQINSGFRDCAFIESDTYRIPSSWIPSEDYNDPKDISIDGTVTDEGLENRVGQNYGLTMQGRYSGRHDTTLTGVIKGGLLGQDVKALVADYNDTVDGDSGGPVFHQLSEGAYICGAHTGTYDSDDDNVYENSVSTTAETVEEELGGNFI